MGLTTCPQHLGNVRPRRVAALATGLNDAGQGGDHPRALLGAGAIADAPGDHPMVQHGVDQTVTLFGLPLKAVSNVVITEAFNR
jgi:hypothetical protein